MFGQEEIQNRFGTHSGSVALHNQLRRAFIALAEELDEALPDGRAKNIAFNELEITAMWSHKAVALNDPLVSENNEADAYRNSRMSALKVSEKSYPQYLKALINHPANMLIPMEELIAKCAFIVVSREGAMVLLSEREYHDMYFEIDGMDEELWFDVEVQP